MGVLKLLVPLVVFGTLVAKLVLDWAAGRRPFSGTTDALGSSSFGDHDGWCGDSDDGGGSCDSGH